MDCDLNLEELVRENSQPSYEGLNGGVSGTNLEFPFYETEPASLRYESVSLTCCKYSLNTFSDFHPLSLITCIFSFLSVMRNEDLRRETGTGQMFEGSSSNSDSHTPNDIPGFAHSYATKFTPAEEIFERCR